jgi:hypothetical protein
MGIASVTRTVPVAPAVAERCWYDTDGWPAWVEGLEEVVAVDGDWPHAGSSVTWLSSPAGRGRVTERVVLFDPAGGHSADVQDDSIRGRQTVTFEPTGGGVRITLRLQYDIRAASLITPLVDALFVRRAMKASLGHTLDHFAVQCLATAPGSADGDD